MYKVVIIIFFACTGLTQAQTTSGNCSPSSQFISNNIFVCINQSLTASEKDSLQRIRTTLETAGYQSESASKLIAERLRKIATNTSGQYSQLVELRHEIEKRMDQILPILSRIEEKVENKLFAGYLYIPPPEHRAAVSLDPKLDPKGIRSSRSRAGSLREALRESSCSQIKGFSSSTLSEDAEELSIYLVSIEAIDCNDKRSLLESISVASSEQLDRIGAQLFEIDRKYLLREFEYQTRIHCLNEKTYVKFFQILARNGQARRSPDQPDPMDRFEHAITFVRSGCPLQDAPEVQQTLDELVRIEDLELMASPKLAFARASLHKLPQFENNSKSRALIKIAHERAPDTWQYMAEHIRNLAAAQNWLGIYEITNAALSRNTMNILYGNSEEDISRRVIFFWWHLSAANETGVQTNFANAAAIGYNSTALLFRLSPSPELLHQIIFFSGHLWRNKSISSAKRAEYFQSLLDASDRLRSAKMIDLPEFTSLMQSLSWACLLASEMKCVDASTAAGLATTPQSIALMLHRAHFLMIDGKKANAAVIYSKVSALIGPNGQTGEALARADIQLLKRAGLPL